MFFENGCKSVIVLTLIINYYLLVGLLICYKLEGFDTLFYILISLISLERLIIIFKSIFINVQQRRLKMLRDFLFNLIFIDNTLGKDCDGHLAHKDQIFFIELNILSHLINSVPIIQNLWILLNKSTNDNYNKYYTACIVYGFFHMFQSECLFRLWNDNQKKKLTINIKYVMTIICKKICFYMIIAQLISYHPGFISLYAIFLVYKFLIQHEYDDATYFIDVILLIQAYLSKEIIDTMERETKAYLVISLSQNIMIQIIFLIKIAIYHSISSLYDMLIYVTFIFSLVEICQNIYCYYLYHTKGPYQLIFSQQIDNQNYFGIFDELSKSLQERELVASVRIYFRFTNLNFYENEDCLEFLKTMLLSKQKYKSILFQDENYPNTFSVKVNSNQLIIYFRDTNYEKYLVKLVAFLSDYQQFDQEKLQVNIISLDNLQRSFINEIALLNGLVYFDPNQFKSNSKCINFVEEIYIKIIQVTVIQKNIQQYVPINILYVFYDLYD